MFGPLIAINHRGRYRFQWLTDRNIWFGKHLQDPIQYQNSEFIETTTNWYIRYGHNWWDIPKVGGGSNYVLGSARYNQAACISFKRKYINFHVAKCASTSIKGMTLETELGINLADQSGDPEEFIYRNYPAINIGHDVALNPELDNFLRFFVWLDPVERFISLSNYVLDKKTVGLYLKRNPRNLQTHIEQMHHMVKVSKKILPLEHRDFHFASVSDNLFQLRDQRLWLVRLKDLDSFVQSQLGLTPQRVNAHKGTKLITAENVPENITESVRNLWKDDYELYSWYENQNRVWNP